MEVAGLATHASKAAGNMVVGQPAGLHEGVTDRRAHEAEPTLLQLLAHRVRLRRGGGDIPHRPPDAAQRAAADEPPDVPVERAELLLDAQQGLGIGDGGLDLEPVADDSGVGHQLADLGPAVFRDVGRIESGKGPAVPLALAQDRAPGESRLRAFEREELEQDPVVVHRPTPLLVVVGAHGRVRARPRAALPIVRLPRFRHLSENRSSFITRDWTPSAKVGSTNSASTIARAEAPACIRATKTWTSSPASAPTRAAPTTRSVFGSMRTFIRPAVSSTSTARAMSPKGMLALSNGPPRSRASFSVSPTPATCGSVKAV